MPAKIGHIDSSVFEQIGGKMKNVLLAAAAMNVLCTAGAFGAQVSLTPANVIGGSATYGGSWDSGSFNATNILDDQSGTVDDVFGQTYWLNPDNGPANAYIVIDLGAAYRIGSIELFNTHNSGFNDRGTGNFQIRGANSVTPNGANGMQVSGPTTVLVSSTLAAISSANDPIEGETFNVSNTNQFRYIVFEPLTVATSGGSCCGANNYGLNELRVFDASAVPEPGTLSTIGAVGLAIVWRSRRRA
jgi:hypothetical protein